MKILIILLCVFFSFGCNAKAIPDKEELIFFARSYSDFESGSVVVYVPVNKPCINVISSGNNYEFCDLQKNINGVNATLDKGAESGIWVVPEFNCEVRHSPISSSQCHFFKDNRWLLEV
ncbi:hypothetical protein [Vibrio cholerae]|uniref:hypothetical protein n=1 Tax=Vibrio cholerae TaxID=666 RepID=UPI001C30C6BB